MKEWLKSALIRAIKTMAQQKQFTYILHPDKCGNLFYVSDHDITHIPNEEALKYLQAEYKAVTGIDIPMRAMGSKSAPMGLRLFQALGKEDLYNEKVAPTSKD